MPYDLEKTAFGRKAIYILEIYMDHCVNTYGVAPCTASGPAATKCFNTLATCQDRSNFTQETIPPGEDPGIYGKKVYRFASIRADNLQQPGEAPTFPTLLDVDTAPTRLEPGKGLGVRATCSVTLQDHPWTDSGVDPYLVERGSDADTVGSFWGKWLARNPFYEGRTMIIRQGYLTHYDSLVWLRDSNGEPILDTDGEPVLVTSPFEDYALMESLSSRRYVIHRITGPDSTGRVVIEGKDPLKFADVERAKWPRISEATLPGDITNSATSFSINDPGDVIGDAFAASQPYIRIDDEVMRITAYVAGSGDLATITVTRATLPSFYTVAPTAESHDLGATVQLCWLFEDDRIDDVVYFLLNTGANIDDYFLPLSDWQAIIDNGFQNRLMNRLLVEPVGIKTLLEELTQLSVLLWWDERAQEVKLDVLIPLVQNLQTFTDDDAVAGSVAVTRDVKNRVSQTWIYFGQRTPLEVEQKASNYQRVSVRADLDAETVDEYGSARIAAIWTPWLKAASDGVANEIASRMQNQYRDTKNVISLKLDPKDDEHWTGDVMNVATHLLQDFYGASPTKTYRCLQVSEEMEPAGVKLDYLLEEVRTTRSGLITPDEEPGEEPDPFPDYDAASETLKNRYAFIAPDSGNFADGRPPYQIV